MSSYGWYEKSLGRSHNYQPVQFDFLKITGGKILEGTFIFVPFSKLFELAAPFAGQKEEELLVFQIKATSIRDCSAFGLLFKFCSANLHDKIQNRAKMRCSQSDALTKVALVCEISLS